MLGESIQSCPGMRGFGLEMHDSRAGWGIKSLVQKYLGKTVSEPIRQISEYYY